HYLSRASRGNFGLGACLVPALQQGGAPIRFESCCCSPYAN
ncbi:hypothetical protein LINPERHAP2_LOCUS9072, partial [Linum perenne]